MEEKGTSECLTELRKMLEIIEGEEDEDLAVELLERAVEEAERCGAELEEKR